MLKYCFKIYTAGFLPLMLPLCNNGLMGLGQCVVSLKRPTKSPVARSLKGSLSRRIISFGKGTSTKLRAYATTRMKEISQGGESTPSVYPFAMDTSGSFCDTAIFSVKFSNEPGSEPLLAWKRASWVQETCLLIQATVLRTAIRLFRSGLNEFFDEYEQLFDVPPHSRTDNDVSGLAPIYIPAAG